MDANTPWPLDYTSLAKTGNVCGSVGLGKYVSEQHYSTSYEWITMKFYGGVRGGTMKNGLNAYCSVFQ